MKGPTKMLTINQAVLNADWPLLCLQKATLVTLANKLQATGDLNHEHLDGVLAYLDAAMDAAAEVVGAEAVFGTSQ